MDSLDEHFASINNTILTSKLMIDASFQSLGETRAVVYAQRMQLKQTRTTLDGMTGSYAPVSRAGANR